MLTPRERAFLERNPEIKLNDVEDETTTISEKDSEKASENEEEIIGFTGWLSILVTLLVLGTFLRMSGTITEISTAETESLELIGNDIWETYKRNVWILMIADLLICFFASYRLIFKHKPITIQIVICCLWLIGPVKTLIALKLNETPGDLIGLILASCVIPTIWTLYLIKSSRVKKIYSLREEI